MGHRKFRIAVTSGRRQGTTWRQVGALQSPGDTLFPKLVAGTRVFILLLFLKLEIYTYTFLSTDTKNTESNDDSYPHLNA